MTPTQMRLHHRMRRREKFNEFNRNELGAFAQDILERWKTQPGLHEAFKWHCFNATRDQIRKLDQYMRKEGWWRPKKFTGILTRSSGTLTKSSAKGATR